MGVQTDGTGKASVTLKTSDRYAGDNYVVQAGFDNWTAGNTTATMVQTGVITNWKRIYIEKDKMFRQGGLLAQNAAVSDTEVHILNWADLPPCGGTPPCYRIAVFDKQSPYEGQHDEPYVGSVTTDGGGNLVLHLVQADGTTPYTLNNGYSFSPLDFSSVNSAGVGVLGSGFHEADLGSMWQAYDNAFVSLLAAPEGAGAVPYLSPEMLGIESSPPTCPWDGTKLQRILNYCEIWFNHFSNRQNYMQLLGVNCPPVSLCTFNYQ